MSNFDKAVDFYLRGFNSSYIKRRTGISMQSLLKQLLSSGIRYTKDDIYEYQKAYISSHFTLDEMEDAYRQVSMKFDDIYKASRGRNVEFLGCGFGDYKRVLVALLGQDRYSRLRNECWQKKQVDSVQRKYGASNVFCREVFDSVVSKEVVLAGREKRVSTLLERYGVSAPNANIEIQTRMLETMKATNLVRYGVENAMQNPTVAALSNQHRMETMRTRYGADASVQVPEICKRIFEARVKNGHASSSKPEDCLYEMLVSVFGEMDVSRNVCVDARYPFHVDFYVKSRDLFIELNGDKCHNDHWFDENNARDLQIVRAWHENMVRVEEKTGRISKYRKYIEIWTDRDVRKRSFARLNNLNYLVFWDGTCLQRKGQYVPRLEDAREWFAAGCPNSKDWLVANTW